MFQGPPSNTGKPSKFLLKSSGMVVQVEIDKVVDAILNNVLLIGELTHDNPGYQRITAEFASFFNDPSSVKLLLETAHKKVQSLRVADDLYMRLHGPTPQEARILTSRVKIIYFILDQVIPKLENSHSLHDLYLHMLWFDLSCLFIYQTHLSSNLPLSHENGLALYHKVIKNSNDIFNRYSPEYHQLLIKVIRQETAGIESSLLKSLQTQLRYCFFTFPLIEFNYAHCLLRHGNFRAASEAIEKSKSHSLFFRENFNAIFTISECLGTEAESGLGSFESLEKRIFDLSIDIKFACSTSEAIAEKLVSFEYDCIVIFSSLQSKFKTLPLTSSDETNENRLSSIQLLIADLNTRLAKHNVLIDHLGQFTVIEILQSLAFCAALNEGKSQTHIFKLLEHFSELCLIWSKLFQTPDPDDNNKLIVDKFQKLSKRCLEVLLKLKNSPVDESDLEKPLRLLQSYEQRLMTIFNPNSEKSKAQNENENLNERLALLTSQIEQWSDISPFSKRLTHFADEAALSQTHAILLTVANKPLNDETLLLWKGSLRLLLAWRRFLKTDDTSLAQQLMLEKFDLFSMKCTKTIQAMIAQLAHQSVQAIKKPCRQEQRKSAVEKSKSEKKARQLVIPPKPAPVVTSRPVSEQESRKPRKRHQQRAASLAAPSTDLTSKSHEEKSTTVSACATALPENVPEQPKLPLLAATQLPPAVKQKGSEPHISRKQQIKIAKQAQRRKDRADKKDKAPVIFGTSTWVDDFFEQDEKNDELLSTIVEYHEKEIPVEETQAPIENLTERFQTVTVKDVAITSYPVVPNVILTIPEPLKAHLKALQEGDKKALLVGGWVRDALLGLLLKRNIQNEDIDIITYRQQLPEPYSKDALVKDLYHVEPNIDVICTSLTLAHDARRRDCSINALYCDEEGRVIDPLGVFKDITSPYLNMIGNLSARLEEDPSRILRLLRFRNNAVNKLIPGEYFPVMRQHSCSITELPFGKYRKNIEKLFLRGYAQNTFLFLVKFRFLHYLLPLEIRNKVIEDFPIFYPFMLSRCQDMDKMNPSLPTKQFTFYHILACFILPTVIEDPKPTKQAENIQLAIEKFCANYKNKDINADSEIIRAMVTPILRDYVPEYQQMKLILSRRFNRQFNQAPMTLANTFTPAFNQAKLTPPVVGIAVTPERQETSSKLTMP